MKKSIHTPHDRFSRAALSNQRVARAFFETHLPPEVLAQVDLSTLTLTQDTFVDAELQLAITDMLFTVQMGQQPGYLYLLVESQSRAERFMPLRVLKYKIDIIDQHLKMNEDPTLPVVYAMVLYNGKVKYNEPVGLLELFREDQQALAQTSLLHPFQLIDLTQVPEEAIRQQVWLHIVEGCLKHIYDRDVLPFVKSVLQAMQQAEAQGGQSLVQAALTYLMTAGDVSDNQLFMHTIEQGLSTQTRETLMTIAQQFEAKGMQQGLHQGRQEGEYSLLVNLLEHKFKTVPETYRQRLAKANAETLLQLGKRVLEAQALEDIFDEAD